MLIASKQMIANICVYAVLWVGKKVCTTLDQDIYNMLLSSSTKEAHLLLNEDLPIKNVSDVLGIMCDSYVAMVVKRGDVQLPGTKTLVIGEEEKQ